MVYDILSIYPAGGPAVGTVFAAVLRQYRTLQRGLTNLAYIIGFAAYHCIRAGFSDAGLLDLGFAYFRATALFKYIGYWFEAFDNAIAVLCYGALPPSDPSGGGPALFPGMQFFAMSENSVGAYIILVYIIVIYIHIGKSVHVVIVQALCIFHKYHTNVVHTLKVQHKYCIHQVLIIYTPCRYFQRRTKNI